MNRLKIVSAVWEPFELVRRRLNRLAIVSAVWEPFESKDLLPVCVWSSINPLLVLVLGSIAIFADLGYLLTSGWPIHGLSYGKHICRARNVLKP